MNWQPIETAPKDKPILIWDGNEYAVAEWLEKTDLWTDGCDCYHDATHWMSLPEPPDVRIEE